MTMTKEEAIQELKEINTALESWSGFTKYPHALYIAIDMAIEALKDRPHGEWKPKNHHTDYCSSCGFEETQWHTADYNFCPNCGADMRGGTE